MMIETLYERARYVILIEAMHHIRVFMIVCKPFTWNCMRFNKLELLRYILEGMSY